MPSLGIIQKGKIVAKATTAVKVTAADESTDATCNLLFCTDATGDLPPKTGSNLTFNSGTGVLTATSFSGSGSGLTFATNVDTFLQNPSSVNLRTAVTDETGTGSLVFGTGPTIVSPLTLTDLASSEQASGVVWRNSSGFLLTAA